MKSIIVSIKRSNSIIQKFEYSGDLAISVITLLNKINNQKEIKDMDGNIVEPIEWECSCQQGSCGACAMIINGIPKLACDVIVASEVKDNKIDIRPLTKFPHIQDLKVDRSELFESMKNLNQWIESDAEIDLKNLDFSYQTSQCIKCGCCLVACPTYMGGEFKGPIFAISSLNLLLKEKNEEHYKMLKENYKDYFYAGCAHSCNCFHICPMDIPTQKTISEMNKNSVWGIWQLFSRIKEKL